jgi:hypothetical protein
MEAMTCGRGVDRSGRSGRVAEDDGKVGEVIDWRVAHAALVRLGRDKAAYDAEEARWLLVGRAAGVHVECGYGSYLEYLERVLGYGPRQARERLRVAEALVRLPETMAALERGELRWSGVRELTRVATPETEAEWIAAATNKTIREIEEMVSGRMLGDRPDDVPRPDERMHVLRLELKGTTYAAFRQVVDLVRREVGHSLSDDETMRLICGHALARLGADASAGAGRARRWATARSSQRRSETNERGDDRARARRGQWGAGPRRQYRRGPGRAPVGRSSAGILRSTRSSRSRGHGMRVGRWYQIVRGRCVDCERLWQEGGGRTIEIDETASRSTRPADGCDAQVIGATHGGRPGRASQSPPPRYKRAALLRAHGRCEVPGCRHSGWVEVHHIRFRSEGGTHEPGEPCGPVRGPP